MSRKLTKGINVNKHANDLPGFEGLANGVILQAVADYRSAVRAEKKGYKMIRKRPIREEIRELRDWFLGPDFSFWTDVDGKYILDRIDRELSNEN